MYVGREGAGSNQAEGVAGQGSWADEAGGQGRDQAVEFAETSETPAWEQERGGRSPAVVEEMRLGSRPSRPRGTLVPAAAWVSAGSQGLLRPGG